MSFKQFKCGISVCVINITLHCEHGIYTAELLNLVKAAGGKAAVFVLSVLCVPQKNLWLISVCSRESRTCGWCVEQGFNSFEELFLS